MMYQLSQTLPLFPPVQAKVPFGGFPPSSGSSLSISSPSLLPFSPLSLIPLPLSLTVPPPLYCAAGTGMELVLGVYPVNLTTAFALSPGAADRWVEANVVPWISTVNITTLAVSLCANSAMSPLCWHHYYLQLRDVTISTC